MITDFVAQHQFRSERLCVEPWLWLNVSCLDAPFIAVLWQLLLAHDLRLQLGFLEPLVLGIAVWCVYAGDQILDAFKSSAGDCGPVRKRFYRRNLQVAWRFGVAIFCVSVPFAYQVLTRKTFVAGMLLTFPVICYFACVHLLPFQWRSRWPREAMVAMIFSVGSFLGVWVDAGRNSNALAGPALLFALLCWLNVSAIETWEWQIDIDSRGGAPSASARWAAEHLLSVAGGIAALAVLLAVEFRAPLTFSLAVFGSSVALAWLERGRARLPVSVARVVADAALCTPLLPLLLTWFR